MNINVLTIISLIQHLIISLSCNTGICDVGLRLKSIHVLTIISLIQHLIISLSFNTGLCGVGCRF